LVAILKGPFRKKNEIEDLRKGVYIIKMSIRRGPAERRAQSLGETGGSKEGESKDCEKPFKGVNRITGEKGFVKRVRTRGGERPLRRREQLGTGANAHYKRM